MPVKRCTLEDRPGFKWGDAGKCYTYAPGNSASMAAAKLKAEMQGAAVKVKQVQAGKSSA